MDSGVLITFALLILSLEAFLKLCSLLFLFWMPLSHSCVDSFVYVGLRFKHWTLRMPGKHSTTVLHAHIPQPSCSPLSSTSFSRCLLQRLWSYCYPSDVPSRSLLPAELIPQAACVVYCEVCCVLCVVGCVEWCVGLGVSCLCVVCVSQRETDWGRFVFSIISSLLFCQITARSWSILSRKHICFCLMSCFHFFHFPGEFSLFTKAVKRLWCSVFTHGIKNTKERVLRK